jgi:hypothetical protein
MGNFKHVCHPLWIFLRDFLHLGKGLTLLASPVDQVYVFAPSSKHIVILFEIRTLRSYGYYFIYIFFNVLQLLWSVRMSYYMTIYLIIHRPK